MVYSIENESEYFSRLKLEYNFVKNINFSI